MLPNFDNDIQNPLIDSLRKKIEDTYGVDTSEISNEQLLFKHGQDLQKNGYTMSKMRSEYGDEFTDQYFDIKNRPSSGRGYLDEISSGFKEQGYGLLGMPFQAAGLVSGAVGDAVGVDLGVEDYLMQKGSEIAQKGQQDPRTIQSIDDVRFDNPSEIARFLLGGVGAATPSVLESAAVFTGAGGVGYTIAKSRAKKALAETIKNKGVKTGDQAVKDVFQELVKQRARQGFNTGSQVGLGVSSIGLGVGEIYGELYQYTQLDPSDPDYVSPATARALSASFGTLAGSLDMLSAGKLLSRMTGATTEKSASYLKRLLQALPEGIVLEGGTEVAQEFLNMAAEKYAKGEELEFTDQEIVRMIDAGILGAIGGTGFSTVGAIPGPKKPQDPEVGSEEIASETKEVRAQRELLDTMKEESTDTLRYQVGDKVQTAYGQKGVVKEVRAEESVVEMADGTVREIRNDRLAEALEPPVVEPPKVDPDKAKQDVAKPTEVVPEPAIPKHEEPSAEEQFVELEGLNGNAVKVTPQTKKDIATLLKYYRKWQKEDMYTFKGRSKLSGKGWDSSDFTRMEIKLGPDRALIRGKRGITNKAALVELGYLDNNGNWHKETPADRAFVKEEFQKLKDARLKVIADNDYIAVGKKVKTAGRILGEIESITKDGHVVVDGEEYDPKRLYRVKEPKPKKVKDPQSPSNPNSTPALNFLGTEEDVADKEITYFYYMANGRLSQTTKKLGKHKDRSSIKTALIDMFVKELPKGKSAVGNAAKIRIGEEEFLAAYDEDGFDFGSIKITKTEIEQAQINKKGKEEKDNGKKGVPQKTSLSEPIFTKVADEDNPDTVFDENGEDPLEMFTDLVEEDDIIGESGLVGGDFSRNISQITKSKALLILKKGDKLRIVSVGHPNAKNKIPYVYDGTRQGASRSRYIELSTMLKDWSVTGKLVSNKAVPFTDVLYPDSDAFNNDQILKNAVEAIDSQVSEDKADLELTHEIQKANKEEAQLDDTIAAIQQQLKELKGESDPNIQASAIDDDDKAAKIAQLEAQLEVLLKQKEQLARERKTAIAKKKVRMDKGEAQGRGAVREGVDGTEEGGEGFTTSTTMAENVNRGDASKIWVKYLHKLTPQQFERVLDTSNTVAPAGSKRGKNAKKIFESVGRSSNAKEFFSLVRDMVGGTETGRKDLIAAYNENPTLFDNYLTKLYQRLINDNATKAYKKDGKLVADPMDTDKRDMLRDMLVRYFKQRGDVVMKTVDGYSYEQARRGDEIDVTLQEPPVPQQTPEPTPAPVEEEAPPSQRDIRVEKFKQLKDTLKAYELPVDVGLFAGLMKVDLGPAINKEPNEVYEAALDEILHNLNIENELESADRESFMEFFKNRTSIEDIAVMFDQGGSKIGVAEEQNQGDALFLDGYELDHVNVDEGRLNPNRSRVPIIDPTTGRREITQTGTTSLEAIDHSYSEARRDPRRYIAQVENPVAKHPGRVEEAQAAMRRFAPLDGPFSAQSAIRQIIDQFPHLGYITNVARMLSDNKFLNGYTIELVPWERYRPYARVNGTLTRAVHIRNQKKILVSDAYWGINETLKSDEALAAVILHELLHPALNPVLDVVLELQGSGAVTSEVDAQTKELATSLHSSMEKLMPYLREQSAGDSKLRYGLTSVDEFFSVFASDPYFRDFLSRTPLPDSMRRGGVLQTVLDFIYRILAKLNFATAKTDSALDYATEQMAELIEKSNSMSHALDARGNKIQPASAFHGSPHNVDRFSTEYIGTGEGAQAFGYGLYFASNKEVAKYYAKKEGKKRGKWGKVYKVDLKPSEDEYLVYDKTFEDQPPKVRKALTKLGYGKSYKIPKGWRQIDENTIVSELTGFRYTNLDHKGEKIYRWERDRYGPRQKGNGGSSFKETFRRKRESGKLISKDPSNYNYSDIIHGTESLLELMYDPGERYDVQVKMNDASDFSYYTEDRKYFLDFQTAESIERNEEDIKRRRMMEDRNPPAGEAPMSIKSKQWSFLLTEAGRDHMTFRRSPQSLPGKQKLTWKIVDKVRNKSYTSSDPIELSNEIYKNHEAPLPLPESNALGKYIYKDIASRIDQFSDNPSPKLKEALELNEYGWTPEMLVSALLLDNGIRGNKYLDGSSRGRGEGDYNYVIFDDSDIEILDNNFQGSAIDTEFEEGLRSEGPYFYREVLNDISERSKQGSTEYNIIQAINILRGGKGDGSEAIRSASSSTSEIDPETKEQVKDFARASVELIDEAQINEELDWGQKFSGEHDVYFDEGRQEYIKAYRGSTPLAEYLERLLLHNHYFPEVRLQLDGFVEREASDSGRRMLMPVISQKALKEDSKAPTPLGVINTEMLKKGFRNQGITGLSTGEPYNTYIRGSVRVRDLTSRNAIIQDGVPYLFDPYIDKGVEQSIEGMEIEIGIIERILEGNVRYDRDPQATKYMERFNLSNNEDALNQLESLVQEMEYVQSQDIQASAIDGDYIDRFQDDFDPSISANPDENMKVMMESNAASFNELVTELVKVYQQIGGEKLGIDLETFIDKYGSPGSTNLSTIKKRLEKDLSPFMDSIDDIRIDNAGLNRVAFNWGRRKGVANLESVRTKARKELQNRILAEEMAEKAIIESKRTYEDLENGRFPPIAKQVENILGKATTFNFETLRDYVTSLPNAEITQADVRAAQDLTKKEIERVMELLVELPGEAETMKKGELMDALKTLGVDSISGDTKTHAVKRMAIMRAIRESKGQMALYRLSKGKIGADQQTMLNLGRRIAAAKDLDTLGKIAIMSDVKGTPFRHFAKLKEAEITERNALEKIKQDQEIYSKIDLGLKVRSDVLRASLGELQPVSIHDGASILTMEWDDKEAQWKRGENFQVKIKNGKIVDRAQFVKVNRETLRFVNDPDAKKEFGEEPWFDLMREQALLAMAEPIGEEYFHVQRATWMSGLQGLTERFSKLGYEGMKLAQMSSQTVALFRDYSSKSQALSLQFNASAQRLMSALKIGGREFYAGIYQDIWWWFDNHPEFANNEEQAFSELWKYLRKAANIPDRTLLDDNARRLTKDMVAKTLAARDFEKSVNKQLGNRIKDDEFKVQSYIDGELVDFYRDPIDIGYATMPRSINDGMVLDTNKMMQKAGWRGEAANELIKEAQSLIDQGDLETMQKIYKSMFTDEVVERFLKPFLHSDVRQSVFRGPTDADGHNPFIGNTFIREAFRVSGGDIYAMTDLMFDKLSIDTTQQERTKWKYYFLKQVDNKYLQLKNVADRLETERVEQGLHDSHLMRNTPQSLDSRMMESRLPKEFFYYTMYDEVTSSIRLALQVATKTFGRQGDNAQKAFTGGRATFEEARAEFNVLMSKATNGSHKEPWKHYSREVKKEAYRLLRLDGHSNPEKKWNELYSKSVALGELNRSMEHLARYYGKDNAAGPYKDANLLLELLGVQALSVLNNPKSSFWQNLGLFEFPMAFRGLNKMAGKGTAAALGNFVNQTFGGMAEAMGMEMEKTGRYAQYLNNTHFRLDEMDLDFKTYVGAQLGSGGELAGHEPRKYLRMVKRAMMFNKRKNVSGTRAPFDFLTVIKGIFPYANNVINHSIGVGAIHAYNDLVIQVAEEIERRGITEYSGEFTAQDLGMGEGVGEWIVGEGDGYRRMNELLVSHGLPTVTRMAFDFIDRKKIDKNAFPIERNAALLINTIAMDQISGDGFNAKPAWLYSNEYLRYFNTFLGWPLGKMGRDLTAVIRDSDDPTTTYIALIKYIGLLTSVYMPLSLSFGMMIDWYDEEMLEKPNNLPPITPWAALPLVGLPIAMSDPNFTIYSVTSRLAKAGVPFGMGTELLNGIFSKGDPYGASRELSLDSRIFMFSMFKNIYDAMGTWIHQGEFDWETVGRPIAYGVGGNSVIQMVDLATAKMDIDSEERRVADYIGLKNTIKKTAFMMGLELRPPFKGGGRPTPLSVNTRQMARAAYAGDSQGFLEQYQEALQAARDAGKENPEQAVIDSYKTRSLRIGITRTRMTDEEWNMLMSVLDENDRRRVMQAVSAHEHYLRLIGGQRRAPSIRRTLDANEARMRAAALLFS